MPETKPGITRVYVTCMGTETDVGCGDSELYEGDSHRAGRRAAREHAARTGHLSHVSVETEYVISPEEEPEP